MKRSAALAGARGIFSAPGRAIPWRGRKEELDDAEEAAKDWEHRERGNSPFAAHSK